VAQFLARFLAIDVHRLDATQLWLAPAIQSVLDEPIRWEKVPDKREPCTPAMWVHLHKATTGVNDDYTLEPSICNWFGCGLSGGFWLPEWAQETGARCLSSPLLDDVAVPKASCLPGLKFRLCNNRRVSLREAKIEAMLDGFDMSDCNAVRRKALTVPV
jgi:hypothetical protein